MVTIRSTIPEAGDAFFDDIEKKVELATRRAMTRTALVGEQKVKRIVEKEAYDTGRFLRSVTSTILKQGDLLRLLIGTNLGYALTIEEGRKPGRWPNLDALVRWCARQMRRQGVNARVNVSFDQLKAIAKTGTRGHKSQAATIARQQLSFVYLVGRKIATKGIKGKLIFGRLQDELLQLFRADVQKELESVR